MSSNISFLNLFFLGLKLLKSTKLILVALSFASYALLMGPFMALVFLVGLIIHEYGHVWAMQKCGIPTKGFYLIPFVGGVAIAERPFEKRWEEVFIAAMGPIFGLLAAPLCFVLGYIISGDLKASLLATKVVILLNLFNLLPVAPLDGGRIVRASLASINKNAGLIFLVGGVALASFLTIYLKSPMLFLITVMAAIEAREEFKRQEDITRMNTMLAIGGMMTWLILIALCVTSIYFLSVWSGDMSMIKALQE